MNVIAVAALALLSTPVAAQTEPAKATDSKRVLFVVAKQKDLDANHYLWAAEMAAARLRGDNNQVLEGGLAAGLKEAREKAGTVRGIVEIVVNVYSWDEDVRITCYDTK